MYVKYKVFYRYVVMQFMTGKMLITWLKCNISSFLFTIVYLEDKNGWCSCVETGS